MQARVSVCVWSSAAILSLPSTVAAQDRPARELVDLVVRDGPQAAAIRAAVEVVRRDQSARLAPSNPVAEYSREGAGFTEFLQVEQSLPAFGWRGALTRAGVAAAAAAEAERDARLWILRADAAGIVAQVAADQARLDIAETYTRDLERVVEVLRSREREGEGSRFDRLRAEQELYDARRLVTSAAVALADGRATVQGMLPPEAAPVGVAGPVFTAHSMSPVEVLLSRAAQSRPELRALRAAGQRAAFESDAARRARLPSPRLFGGLKQADVGSGRDRSGVFGISLSVPLFDAGAREAARWSAERVRIDLERAALEHQVRAEVVRAATAVTRRQAAVLEDEPGAPDELTRVAEVAYREGEVGILELLDAFRTASRTRLRRIDIQLDARLAQIALERAVGDILWP